MAFGSLGNPLEYFQIGQGLGTANAPSMAGPQSVMDMFKAQQENQMKLQQSLGIGMALEQYKNQLPPSALQQSEITKNDAMAKAYSNGKNVFERNPNTGELSPIGNIGRFDRVFSQNTPSGAEAASLSDIDEVLKTLPSLKSKLQSNPFLATIGNIPFVNPGYKSDYDYLIKTLASIVGGKNLTLPERNIVQTNLPGPSDMFSQDVLQKKLDRIERVMSGVKTRMTGGQFGNPLQASRADTATDATTTSPVNMLQENSAMKEKIASGKYDINKLKNIYKQRTGQDYA